MLQLKCTLLVFDLNIRGKSELLINKYDLKKIFLFSSDVLLIFLLSCNASSYIQSTKTASAEKYRCPTTPDPSGGQMGASTRGWGAPRPSRGAQLQNLPHDFSRAISDGVELHVVFIRLKVET